MEPTNALVIREGIRSDWSTIGMAHTPWSRAKTWIFDQFRSLCIVGKRAAGGELRQVIDFLFKAINLLAKHLCLRIVAHC